MRRTSLVVLALLATALLAVAPVSAHPLVHPLAASAPAPIQAPSTDQATGTDRATGGDRVAAVPLAGTAFTATLATARPAGTPWALVAGLLAATSLIAWRPRRALTLALVLVVGVLAFETGIHSTHHLDRADDAASCTVAGVSAQLSADLVDATLDVPRAARVEIPVVARPTPVVAARAVAPDAGRAPPALSA
jgi:hypothetical protein